MKKFVLATACMLVMNGTVLAADDDTQLIVSNSWTHTVKVKEGRILPKEDTVYPGRILKWDMYSGMISNLKISYESGGKWHKIPGCPNGDYAYGLKIKVLPSYNDPKMPRCEID